MTIIKLMLLIIITFLLSFVLAVVGGFLGALYGGNFGCFALFGFQGYESCGLFFAYIGIALGIITGIILAIKHYRS
ncbi:MAG: hypothetical protein HYV33_03995 [Candidatus Kerfeldbacteria bacterium]|nr:hypothetical protein [Candidatus Kerfeldbacteria bacterium]